MYPDQAVLNTLAITSSVGNCSWLHRHGKGGRSRYHTSRRKGVLIPPPHTTRHIAALELLQHAVICLLQSWQLLPLSTRQRTFFKYEKRIRDLSGPDKIFEYFATETKEDGSRCALTSYLSDHDACLCSCIPGCAHSAMQQQDIAYTRVRV